VTTRRFDAIVVGSGISGGWAAKELTERGLQVLLLERGKNVEHIKDYKNATKAPWEYPHRGGRTTDMVTRYPVLKRDFPLNEKNLDWWADESQAPYTEAKRFDWYRGYQVGGRSLMWGRCSFRLSDIDFEANAREGIGTDWPIRYADVAPWYSYVERHAGIAGSVEGLPQLPDGEFQPEMPLTCAERTVKERLAKQYGGTRHLISSRTANLTRPLKGRGACQYRDACWLGCPVGGYFSTQSSTLPYAMATGRLTLRPHSIASEVLYDRDRQRARGVRVVDALTHEVIDFEATVVFLCASALNSTWLLLRSATDVWPGGLGSSSGELGHNLMDHHFKVGAWGHMPELDDKTMFGRRPNPGYIVRYRNLNGDKRPYLRGFAYEVGSGRDGWTRAIAELGVGGDFKDRMAMPGVWSIGGTAFGEILPHHDNKVTLDPDKKDAWGLPVLRMDAEIRENERAMRKDMMNDMAEMLDACGVKNIHPYDDPYFPGMGIHEMGTARMGRSPKVSVLNGHNQVWDAPNVFVTDGACMASTACQNPSLTYMALTARAAEYAVEALKRREL